MFLACSTVSIGTVSTYQDEKGQMEQNLRKYQFRTYFRKHYIALFNTNVKRCTGTEMKQSTI